MMLWKNFQGQEKKSIVGRKTSYKVEQSRPILLKYLINVDMKYTQEEDWQDI